MKFRLHRGGLDESLATTTEVESRDDLIAFLKKDLGLFGIAVSEENFRVAYYGYDERIGWDTYIVTIEGYGVAGFTDGLL